MSRKIERLMARTVHFWEEEGMEWGCWRSGS